MGVWFLLALGLGLLVLILVVVLWRWRRSCSDSSASFEVKKRDIATSELDTNFVMNELRQDDDGTFQASAAAPLAVVGSMVGLSTTVPEAEEHVAANPATSGANGQWIAAVSDFSLRGGYNTTKYCYSKDGGSTWTQQFVPVDNVNKPKTSDGRSWDANSDPVVAFSVTGNKAFCASLYFNVSNSANGIYVAANTVPGSGPIFTSFAQVYPVYVNSSPSTSNFEDKEWIAADPGNANYVYCSWTHFSATSDAIWFSRSTNGAQTWSAPVQVSPPALNGAVQGSAVAADGAGNVWVAWTTFYTNNLRRIFVSKSTNWGQNFSVIGLVATPYFYGPTFSSSYRKEAFPALAVDRFNKTVHLAFQATDNRGSSRILYCRLNNGSGSTFSSPQNLINTSKGNQFFAAIGTDLAAAGRLQVSWFDTRNSTSGNRQLDVYTTRSTNNGSSWGVNQRVTPAKTDVGNASFVGDYHGVAIQAGRAFPVFAFLITPLRTALVT